MTSGTGSKLDTKQNNPPKANKMVRTSNLSSAGLAVWHTQKLAGRAIASKGANAVIKVSTHAKPVMGAHM